MVTEIDFAELKIKDESKLGKIKSATLEFIENPNVDLSELAIKHDLKLKSMKHYFRKLQELGILTIQTPEQVDIALRTIRKETDKALASHATKVATLQAAIGGPLVTRFLPLLDYHLVRGKSCDDLAVEIGEWFEAKLPTKKYVADLELQLEKMEISTNQAWSIARKNFKYLLKALLADRYANRVFKAKRLGLKVNLKKVTEEYSRELERIDTDFEDKRIAIVIDVLKDLGVYDEKQPNFYAACEKGLLLLQEKINFLVDEKNE